MRGAFEGAKRLSAVSGVQAPGLILGRAAVVIYIGVIPGEIRS